MNKVDLLRNQIGMDWSKRIVEDATIEDLDEEAIKRVKENFSQTVRVIESTGSFKETVWILRF